MPRKRPAGQTGLFDAPAPVPVQPLPAGGLMRPAPVPTTTLPADTELRPVPVPETLLPSPAQDLMCPAPDAEVGRPSSKRVTARHLFLRSSYASEDLLEATVQQAVAAILKERGGQPWVDRTEPGLICVGRVPPSTSTG